MFSLWKLILGVEKAFIHSETWRPGSRQSRNISSVYSLPLLPSSAFPHTLWFCNFPPVPSHPIFCWGYLKSCSSHVPCSRITLKYFQICYYIRKRELKLSKSSLGICSCSANKAICWLLTNWPTVLLTKCSKQFRNSSLKAAWIFWRNHSLTAQEENRLDAERGNQSWTWPCTAAFLSASHVTSPDFMTAIFRRRYNYNATLTKWVSLSALLLFWD